MQSAARITDLHACADSGPNDGATLQIMQGSPNILINGLPAARMGDPVSCRLASGAPPIIAEGSSTVFFNGKPAARMGDKISNGGSISLGSSNVFIGDGGAIISIGDGVNVSFGDGCMVYLGCDPPNDSSKSTRQSALSTISSNAQAVMAALDADIENISAAIKAESEALYVEEKSSLENFADENISDELHDALDPLGPVGSEISASAEGLEELGAAIVSGLKLLNSAKTVETAGKVTAGGKATESCDECIAGSKLTTHAKQRMSERNVSNTAIKDALKNPLKVKEPKTDSLGRPSQRYIGKEAEVVINPESRDIISVNPTSTSKAMKLGGKT
ncbi:MAG TPA: PAAR domain-containing protein [Gammaproteobacteria bacterium]|nr:PAAR domain-containing protein [Gammaproteobacteria bacterium]